VDGPSEHGSHHSGSVKAGNLLNGVATISFCRRRVHHGVCLLVMIQSCKKVNVYMALVTSLMQRKMFIVNCALFHVKREHSQDCNSMMVLQDCVDVVKGDPGSCNEACSASSDDGNQVYGLKIEDDADMKEEDGPELVTSPLTEAEHDASHMTCCTCNINKVQNISM
jgi:hypothetical protein